MQDDLLHTRYPIGRLCRTILFFVAFVSFSHFSKIINEEAKHANLMTSLSLFVSGVFLGLAFYGLCSLIRQYRQAEDFKSFLREVKKTINLDPTANEPSDNNSG